jgi:hypothetical protein
MRLVGLLLRLHGPVAHVLHDSAEAMTSTSASAPRARLQNHAAHARVQRQARQLLAHGQQIAALVHRAQLGQQLVAVGNGAARGRFEEGKCTTSPRPSDFMRRITPASEERRISGSVKRRGR